MRLVAGVLPASHCSIGCSGDDLPEARALSNRGSLLQAEADGSQRHCGGRSSWIRDRSPAVTPTSPAADSILPAP